MDGGVQATGPVDVFEFDIIPAGPVELNKWLRSSNFKARQIDPYESEIFTIRIVDREHAGARYEIETAFSYGNKDDLKWLIPKVFELDVVAE